MTSYHVIIADGIDNTQRKLMHETVKRLADSWWHELPDVWVVSGGPDDASGWRDVLRGFVPLTPSRLLVLQVKPTPGGRWAATDRTNSGFTDWFKENLNLRSQSP